MNLILQGLYTFVKWGVTSILIKVVLFAALFYFISEFVPFIASLVPGLDGITALFGNLPYEVVYFLNLFEVPAGINILLSATTTAFIIRRIPGFG